MTSGTLLPVGIDLGTTYSCVGVWRNERVEIIANEQGNRTTPSCVAFDVDERLVGEAAQNQASRNATNTVFGAKRMIGRNFNDPQLQSDIKHWPFKVKDKDGSPVIEVEYHGHTQQFTPTEISAIVLTKMKETAELKLGTVKDAVITVPAYFDNGQRQATKDAGTIAGLNVLRVLSEPTAAALAYGLDARTSENKIVLVYDLGGGTFDVSLLAIEGSDFKVKGTSGDAHLGGEDFDTRLVDYFVKEIERKDKKDISKIPKAMKRLRLACERAKRTLSSSNRSMVEVDSLYDGIDFQSTLSRAKFDELCGDLFSCTIEILEETLKHAKIDKSQIDEVILSGGSSRIYRIQQLISNFFGGKKLNTSINLDEAVAIGAAIQANMLKGVISTQLKDFTIEDVTPLSLGIEIDSVVMARVIKRNTLIPTTTIREFTTSKDFQKTVTFSIYEGESQISKENIFLGKFVLENIQDALKGVPKFSIKFSIDEDGILHVSAVDQVTGSSKAVSFYNYKGHLSKAQIADMTKRIQQN